MPDVLPPPDPPELGENQVEFVFNPEPGNSPGLDAIDFSEYVEALVRALRLVVVQIGGGKRNDVRFQIERIQYNSPLTMVVEGEVEDDAGTLIPDAAEYLFKSIDSLDRGERPPVSVTDDLLRALLRVGQASKKTGLVASVRTRWTSVAVRPKLSDRLELVVEDDLEVDGTIEGFLDMLNVHGKPVIRVYPHIGPFVTGRLPKRLIEKAKASVREYVLVEGTLIYRPNAPHARRVRVKDIHPIEQGEAAPGFSALWGGGRGYRPEMSSVDLIEEIRSGWDD